MKRRGPPGYLEGSARGGRCIEGPPRPSDKRYSPTRQELRSRHWKRGSVLLDGDGISPEKSSSSSFSSSLFSGREEEKEDEEEEDYRLAQGRPSRPRPT